MQNKANPRYTVKKSLLPTKHGLVECPLILNNGIPEVRINNAMNPKEKAYPRSPTTTYYHICKYLNYLDSHGIEYQNATMEQIYTFLMHMYRYEEVSYNTLVKYINALFALYESLATINVPLDQSLYINWPGTKTRVVKKKGTEPQTKIRYLKLKFKAKKTKSWESYTKWYTRDQYRAIADALPLVHRIAFLMTVFLGYRCSSALSVRLRDINLRDHTIKPSHTKTGQKHISKMPDELVQLIQAYLENERSRNPGCASDWLLLNNRGVNLKYHSYNAALKRAAEKVRKEHPELELGAVHTHAGRSTFAAALRTFQLRERRLGHETFSDSEFCILMDWESLKNLKYYDKATRLLEAAEVHEAFYDNFDSAIGEAAGEFFRRK